MISAHDVIEAQHEALREFLINTTDDECMSNSPNRPDMWKKARRAAALAEQWREDNRAAGVGGILKGVVNAADDLARGAIATVGGIAGAVSGVTGVVSEGAHQMAHDAEKAAD